MNKYVIIPGCSDLNRGDQALVWETKRLAEDAGFSGEFYLMTEKDEPVSQSEKTGIQTIIPVLEHPSRIFKSKENISYKAGLKMKWGLVAVFDLAVSLLYFSKPTRQFVRNFLSQGKRKSLKTMEEANAFFVKGGGLLQTYGGITSTYSMYFWVFHILLAKAMQKPVYVMPNSFGPFEGPFVRQIAKKALKSCIVLTSRETYSQKMVQEQLNIQIENFPDLAFYLKKSDLDKKQIFMRFSLPDDRKLVAITMRPYRFPNSKTPELDYEHYRHEMAGFIQWLYAEGYMPVIVEHTLAVNAHENDRACIEDVTKMLGPSEYRLISDPSFNCRDLKCIYSFCDYIVGTRFHSLIFSIGNGIPGIAVTYAGNKAQGIMHDLGLEEYAISISDVSAGILKEKFAKLFQDEHAVKEKIAKYLTEAQNSRKKLIQIIQGKN